MSTAPALQIRDLGKRFRDKTALDGVDLEVAEGSIFGFLGPNGAGKTTTIRILLGLARATSGRAEIFGQDVATAGNDLRRQVGHLPDVPGFYPWMTAPGFLAFTGRLFGLDRATIAERSDALLAMAGLNGVEHKVGGFSRGMKQRLGIAQALMNAPRLLILDEPTSALDPTGRKEVLDMIAALKGRTTVLFSTHILGDVERVCDEVAILADGRVVTQQGLHQLKACYGGQTKVLIKVTSQADAFTAALRAEPWVSSVEVTADGLLVASTDLAAAAHRVPALCVSTGAALQRLEPVEASLEDVFLDLVQHPRGAVA
ncbi:MULTISPECIES: ABC transporter ATP-binding protein [unclassified Luteococcus]|uniref:ABC transporter ATP-binding protein n=1 Tax=unclassified Luteococcus TaxID=2639923 RepID=UPI00313B94D9